MCLVDIKHDIKFKIKVHKLLVALKCVFAEYAICRMCGINIAIFHGYPESQRFVVTPESQRFVVTLILKFLRISSVDIN